MLIFVVISDRDKPLGWLDAPFVSRFEFRAVTTSGERIEIPPSRFEPYDMPFAQNRFYFITKRKKLVDCMGAIYSKQALGDIEGARGKGEIEKIAHEHGKEDYSSEKKNQLEVFLRQYSNHLKSGRCALFRLLGLPQHIWSFKRGSHLAAEGQNIVGWEIEHTEWLYNSGSIDRVYNYVHFVDFSGNLPR